MLIKEDQDGMILYSTRLLFIAHVILLVLECIATKRTLHGVPSSAIMRKSVVMGTVWVFKPTESFRFDQLCISRMVERFGKDDGNWEHIELDLLVNLSGSKKNI
jgi:hypothetical protein